VGRRRGNFPVIPDASPANSPPPLVTVSIRTFDRAASGTEARAGREAGTRVSGPEIGGSKGLREVDKSPPWLAFRQLSVGRQGQGGGRENSLASLDESLCAAVSTAPPGCTLLVIHERDSSSAIHRLDNPPGVRLSKTEMTASAERFWRVLPGSHDRAHSLCPLRAHSDVAE
jgi:hypothetical protein